MVDSRESGSKGRFEHILKEGNSDAQSVDDLGHVHQSGGEPCLVLKYKDVWKLKLDDYGPALVTPLELRLKPDAVPRRAQNRRYSWEHIRFIKYVLNELLQAGSVKKNPNSRWSSPCYVVSKPKGGYRLTIDMRYINSQLVTVAGVIPVFEVILQQLAGSSYFSCLNAFKGYWQFPLAEKSREILSFLTEDGTFSPTRLIQGCSDSVFAFQMI